MATVAVAPISGKECGKVMQIGKVTSKSLGRAAMYCL
jgi:hypothetical protein